MLDEITAVILQDKIRDANYSLRELVPYLQQLPLPTTFKNSIIKKIELLHHYTTITESLDSFYDQFPEIKDNVIVVIDSIKHYLLTEKNEFYIKINLEEFMEETRDNYK